MAVWGPAFPVGTLSRRYVKRYRKDWPTLSGVLLDSHGRRMNRSDHAHRTVLSGIQAPRSFKAMRVSLA